MKSKTIFLSLIICISSCSPLKKLYVPFSEAKTKYEKLNDGVLRIYFDRLGFIYPDLEIKYETFKNSDGRLNNFYSQNRNEYEKLCRKYQVTPFLGDLNNVDASIEPIQRYLIQQYVNKINSFKKDRELIFIIHGFNEYPLEARDSSSFNSNFVTRKKIRAEYLDKDFYFVEIYWDGLSQEGGPKILNSLNSFKIWKYAQASATNAGMELRRILNKIKTEEFRVFTHSHGAAVITMALFNVEKFNEKDYSNPKSWLYNIKQKFSNKNYNTPQQKVRVGMLAPAIPGENVFDEYFNRTINGKETKIKKTNFRFLVGFNENDQITSKYKIAAKKIGSTSLACKASELLRTENMFMNKHIIDYTNFSKFSDGSKQKDHSWLTYMDNKIPFESFIKELLTNY